LPPPAGTVTGTPFVGTITCRTVLGDTVNVTLGTTATSASPVGRYAITTSLFGHGRHSFRGFLDLECNECPRALRVMDLLLATDAEAVNGVLYNGNTTLRNEANTAYSAVNQAGGIS
jgi:hypothetical protein